MTALLDNKTRLVLDKGHVKLIDWMIMDPDLKNANAARASFEKMSDEMGQSEARIVNFLAREGHTSPFRHTFFTFAIRAPLMVVRQHWKYVVGSDHTMDGWNEASRRYVTENEQFYIPKYDEWREAPEDKKQGSGGIVDPGVGSMATQMFIEDVERQVAHYRWALDAGICPEQARVFLPAYSLYISYWWSCSLQSLIHVIKERMEHDAQKEIRDYARAFKELVVERVPVALEAFGVR